MKRKNRLAEPMEPDPFADLGLPKATLNDERHDLPGVRPQPHIHPQPGPIDARGNCPGCAVYEPETEQ